MGAIQSSVNQILGAAERGIKGITGYAEDKNEALMKMKQAEAKVKERQDMLKTQATKVKEKQASIFIGGEEIKPTHPLYTKLLEGDKNGK